jgi:hypothetical protein
LDAGAAFLVWELDPALPRREKQKGLVKRPFIALAERESAFYSSNNAEQSLFFAINTMTCKLFGLA